MKLKFVLKNSEHIDIYAIENKKNIDGKRKKLVGHIFTPSGSAHDKRNAIQVCGFTEAFDYWGCSVFAKSSDKDKVLKRLGGIKHEYIQVKDIQLMFDWKNTKQHTSSFSDKNCLGCYNEPCTCENKSLLVLSYDDIIEGKGRKSRNPYNIKRAEDLELEL